MRIPRLGVRAVACPHTPRGAVAQGGGGLGPVPNVSAERPTAPGPTAARQVASRRNHRPIRMGAAITALALLAGGCGFGGADPDPTGQPRTPSPSTHATPAFHQVALADAQAAADVVNASDAFGLDVLAGSDRSGNLVFSPASAVVALAMLGEGATNAGASELDALLGSSGDRRSEAVNALSGLLTKLDGDPASLDDDDLPARPLLHLANNIVLDDQAHPLGTYLDRLTQFYDTGVQVTDLGTEQGGKVLDAWVREHTGGRIHESGIEPDPSLYLVLQNAILLAARWQEEFDPNVTVTSEFTSSTGQTETAHLMSGRRRIAYAKAHGWAAIELPYRKGLAARFVLPPVGTDPAALDATTMSALDDALDDATPSTVDVALPRFDVTATIDLGDALRAQGLTAIFDPGTRPLERISTEAPLFVGQAVQQATITVGEQGTVAAALTEIAVAMSAPPAPDHSFVANRPFLMVVQESTTGWDLFQTVVRSVE